MSLPHDLPLVSIITPVYNGSAYLDDLIVSVRDQDYPRFEHLVIDDGSNDGGATAAVLKKYPHLRWWSRENRGQYATMNEGLEAASGEIVCFISADDMLAPHAIRAAVEYLCGPGATADGVYGRYVYIDEHNAPYWYQPLLRRAPLSLYRYVAFIAHCSLYLRKQALVEHALYFDRSLHFTGDYDWMVRFGNARLRIGYVDGVWSMVRWHADRASQKHVTAIKDEMRMVMGRYGVNRYAYRLLNVSINATLMLKRLAGAFSRGEPATGWRQVRAWAGSRRGH